MDKNKSIMENWKNIGSDFTEELKSEWINKGFSYEEVRDWIGVGLKPQDTDFAYWLKSSKGENAEWVLNQGSIEDLRQEYQQESERESKNETINIQQYLSEKFLTQKEKNRLKEIIIGWRDEFKSNLPLTEEQAKKIEGGELDLSEYPNLEKIQIWGDYLKSPLTKLELGEKPKLTELVFPNNQLTEIKLPLGEKLEILSLSNNNFNQDLSFLSGLVGLRKLWLGNNKFASNLKPLKNLSGLWSLDIRNTDIDSGLEYLPESVKYFWCLANREGAKAKVIYNLFANEHGRVEIGSYGWIKNLSQRLQEYKQWKELSFTEEEIKEWMKIGLIINEFEIANILRKKDYQPNTYNLKETIKEERWQDIHPEFNYRLRKVWENEGFNKEQTRELTRLGFNPHGLDQVQRWKENGFNFEEIKSWINAGAEVDDYKFAAWLRDTKKETSQWITNYQEDYQILSNRFKRYGLCSECKQPNTGEQWCKDCNSKRLQKDFKNWTSHNPQIDQFIQKYQLEATETNKFLEWIPYEQFTDIKHIADGGFGKVYKAKWVEGNISYWDNKNNEWQREKDNNERETRQLNEQINSIKSESEKNKSSNANELKLQELQEKLKKLPLYKTYREVVLKSLNNSSENTDFLEETEKYKIIDDWFNNIVPCYGLSQDPETKNYLMVMQYMPEGNLRHYLGNNRKLSLKDKFSQLLHIARGLKDIHSKNLVHRDFHSGNILKGIQKTDCLITDLGLCKPANETSKEDKIFGVLPYVAPEVLQSQPYTQKADIYSWGTIAYEVLSGLPPYYDRNHDVNLALEVCQGLRPKLQIKVPQLLEDLIKRCWNTDPKQRPTAQELERILRDWEKDTEFTQQLQEAEEHNKTLSDEVKYPDITKKTHTGAVYHSKLLPTKEITKLLRQNPVAEEYHTEALSELTLDNFNLDELNIQESQEEVSTEQNQEQTPQIIHNPPKGENH